MVFRHQVSQQMIAELVCLSLLFLFHILPKMAYTRHPLRLGQKCVAVYQKLVLVDGEVCIHNNQQSHIQEKE